jgi:hypothetical protein
MLRTPWLGAFRSALCTRDTRWIVSDFVRAVNEANRVKLAWWVSGCFRSALYTRRNISGQDFVRSDRALRCPDFLRMHNTVSLITLQKPHKKTFFYLQKTAEKSRDYLATRCLSLPYSKTLGMTFSASCGHPTFKKSLNYCYLMSYLKPFLYFTRISISQDAISYFYSGRTGLSWRWMSFKCIFRALIRKYLIDFRHRKGFRSNFGEYGLLVDASG